MTDRWVVWGSIVFVTLLLGQGVSPAAAALQTERAETAGPATADGGVVEGIAVSGTVETAGVTSGVEPEMGPGDVSEDDPDPGGTENGSTSNGTSVDTSTSSGTSENGSTSEPVGEHGGVAGAPPGDSTATAAARGPTDDSASASADLSPSYEYRSKFFTVADIVFFSYRNGTSIRSPSGNFTLDDGERRSLNLPSGIYSVSGSERFSALSGDPVSTTVVGYYAVDENGYALTTRVQTWIPSSFDSDSERFVVHGYYDDTNVVIRNQDTGETLWNGTLNESEYRSLQGSSLPHSTHLVVESSRPVSSLTYFDQGYYVPAKNRQFAGQEFYTFAGAAGDWTNDLTVSAFEDNTRVEILNTETGELVWSGTVDGGQIHSEPVDSPTYFTVRTNRTATVSVQPWASWEGGSYHEGLYVPSKSGSLIGQQFVEPTIANDYLYLFAYHNDTEVSVLNRRGELVDRYHLDAGEYVEANPGHGVWSVYADRQIAVQSGFGEASAEFAPVEFGQTESGLIRGTVISDQAPMGNARVYLAEAKAMFSLFAGTTESDDDRAIATTRTAPNGTYEFENVPPGRYAVVAVDADGDTVRRSSVRGVTVGKGETEQVGLRIEAYLTGVMEELRQVEDASEVALDDNTAAAADVYLAGYEEFMAETAVDRATPELFGVMMLFADAAISAANPQKATRDALKEVAEEYIREKIVTTAIHQARDTVVNRFRVSANQRAALRDDSAALKEEDWLLDFEHTESERQVIEDGYEESVPYREAVSGLQGTERNATSATEEVTSEEVPEEFSRGAVINALQLQQRWLQGEGPVDGLVISPTGEVYRYRKTFAHREDYYVAEHQRQLADAGEKVSSVTATGGDAVAVFGPTPTSKVLGVGISAVGTLGEVAFHTAMVMAEYKMSVEWANTQVHWADDADELESAYNDSASYVFREIEDPRTPLAGGDVTEPSLDNVVTLAGHDLVVSNRPQYPFGWPGPSVQWQAVGNASVTVENTGRLDGTRTRVLVVDRYGETVSDVPTVYPGPNDGPFELDRGESREVEYPYLAEFHPLDPFEFHHQTAYLWMEGKFTDTETTTYYVVPSIDLFWFDSLSTSETDSLREGSTATQRMRTDRFAYTSAATETTAMTASNWSELVGNVTELADARVSPSDDTTTFRFAVPENTSEVTFRVVGAPDSDLDLHVTDSASRHVGFNPITGENETQVPDSTYAPSRSGNERISVRDPADETVTVRVVGESFLTNESTSFTLYAETTPDRPPVLGVTPGRVVASVGPGFDDRVSVTVSEVSEQHTVENVTVTASSLSTASGHPLPASVDVRTGSTAIDLSAGESENVSLVVNASDLGRIEHDQTRYVGNVTVESPTVGSVDVPASVLLLDTPIEGVTVSSASPNVTGAHLTPATTTPTVGPPNRTGTVRAGYDLDLTGAGQVTFRFAEIPNATSVEGYAETPTGWRRTETASFANGTTATVPANASRLVLVERSPVVAYNLSTQDSTFLANTTVTTAGTRTPLVVDQLAPGVTVDEVRVEGADVGDVEVTRQSEVRWMVYTTFPNSTYNETAGHYDTTEVSVTLNGSSNATVAVPVTVHRRGDTNGDGVVSLHDAVRLGKAWTAGANTTYRWHADADHDGVVNDTDLQILGAGYSERAAPRANRTIRRLAGPEVGR